MAKPKASPDQMNLPGIDPDLQKKFAFGKPSASKNGKKKLADPEAGPPNLAKPVKVSVPDFSKVKRPKTCLEVDFPIVPINELSKLEGNAGKPIYQMSKWWARRRSSVFRAMLIAAATEAPVRKNRDGSPVLDKDGIPVPDETEAAKAVWDLYYANHQKAGNFKQLKVLDCFMGGGTTLVEGSRLGFQVAGVDLNPVAWFVVKNELACTDPNEVRQFFDQIEAEVKPVIQPFYVADCPRGHKGHWYKAAGTDDPADDQPMPDDFDPLTLAPDERRDFRYAGPEVIYTFWAKHGQCTKPGCGHRTPVFRTPVVAKKKLGVKYIELTCKNKNCRTTFHAELGAARMAPGAKRVVLDTEYSFTELSQPFAQRLSKYAKGKKADKQLRVQELCEMVDDEPGLCCPKCGEFSGQFVRDVLQAHKRATRVSGIDKKHLKIQPPRNSTKHVYCYLLIDPHWLKGASGSASGEEMGGHPDALVEMTERWYEERLKNLRFIEVRGRIKLSEDTSALGTADVLPESVEDDPDTVGDEESGGEEVEADRKEYGLPQFITLSDGRRIDTRKGTIPKQSHFICGKCGAQQDLRKATEALGHAAPVAVYAIQAFCPDCAAEGRIYGGRMFSPFGDLDCRRLVAAESEWHERRDEDLKEYWPRNEITYSYMTHQANFALPRQGYTHWWKMFNSRQLLLLSQILRACVDGATETVKEVREQALGAFQQYLRNQNMFCIYDVGYDKLAPFFSNANYAPKARAIENTSFSLLGRGNLTSIRETVLAGLHWCRKPWDVAQPSYRETTGEPRIALVDAVQSGAELHCGSSSDLSCYQNQTFDLVVHEQLN